MANNEDANNGYLTTKQAAAYLGLAFNTLEHDRMRKTPKIKFYEMPGLFGKRRIVRYKKSDLDEYAASLQK